MQNRVYKYYEFAGVKITCHTPEFKEWKEIIKFQTKPHVADFTLEVIFQDEISLGDVPMLHTNGETEIYDNNGKYIRILRHEKTKEIAMMDIEKSLHKHEIFFSKKYLEAWGSTMFMKIMNLPRLMIAHKAIFLHASFVVWNGEAILFSGKSGIGKSTQAELWRKYKNAVIANGDRAILKKMDGKWYACASPYAGTSNICENIISPIRSIIILTQGNENIVYETSVKESFVSLLKNCSYEVWDKIQLIKALQVMETISKEVPFVQFSCVPNKSAVEMLEKYLYQRKNEDKSAVLTVE